MAELSPVETLRAAAEKLRERAKSTSPGPWRVVEYNGRDIADEFWTRVVIETDAPGNAVEIADISEINDADGTDDANAEWIALVHPGIAEPLADMLATEADFAERYRGGEVFQRHLRVARVLLGVPDANV